jgi:hypothetical protein
MNVPGLRCAGSVRRGQQQPVAFQYDNALETIDEYSCRRPTAYNESFGLPVRE